LLALGHIPDPFEKDNERQVQWVAERDWCYRRTFTPGEGLLSEGRIDLVCDGLDTLAEVSLNGQVIGTADNMFRQYRWPVGGLLQPGENELQIRFGSSVAYMIERQRERPLTTVRQPPPPAISPPAGASTGSAPRCACARCTTRSPAAK
jgi:beta-mannosidase